MVRRIYVEKKPPLRQEANGLLRELRTLLGITSLTGLRLLNRYDVEGLDEDAFRRAVGTVLSEPQVDDAAAALPAGDFTAFAVEYLPGQFDQRADSAEACIQLMTKGERPRLRSARVYLLSGQLSPAEVDRIKAYVINPVEAREAGLETVDSLAMEVEQPAPPAVVEGFASMDDASKLKGEYEPAPAALADIALPASPAQAAAAQALAAAETAGAAAAGAGAMAVAAEAAAESASERTAREEAFAAAEERAEEAFAEAAAEQAQEAAEQAGSPRADERGEER